MTSSSPPSKRRRRKSSAKISEAEKEHLARECRRLRSLFTEVADMYIVRVSAMIQRLVEQMEGGEPGEMDSEVRLSVNQYERILSSIRRLNVKAKKGRRKDLRRVENLAAQIEEIFNR